MRKISEKARQAIEDIATRPEYLDASAKRIYDAARRESGESGFSLRTVQYYVKQIRSEQSGTEWLEDRFSLGSLVTHGVEFGPEDVEVMIKLSMIAQSQRGLFTNRQAVWAMRLRRFPGLDESRPGKSTAERSQGRRVTAREQILTEEFEVQRRFRPRRPSFFREDEVEYYESLRQLSKEYADLERIRAVSDKPFDTFNLDNESAARLAEKQLPDLLVEIRRLFHTSDGKRSRRSSTRVR